MPIVRVLELLLEQLGQDVEQVGVQLLRLLVGLRALGGQYVGYCCY